MPLNPSTGLILYHRCELAHISRAISGLTVQLRCKNTWLLIEISLALMYLSSARKLLSTARTSCAAHPSGQSCSLFSHEALCGLGKKQVHVCEHSPAWPSPHSRCRGACLAHVAGCSQPLISVQHYYAYCRKKWLATCLSRRSRNSASPVKAVPCTSHSITPRYRPHCVYPDFLVFARVFIRVSQL